jgi:hypothetical protein
MSALDFRHQPFSAMSSVRYSLLHFHFSIGTFCRSENKNIFRLLMSLNVRLHLIKTAMIEQGIPIRELFLFAALT